MDRSVSPKKEYDCDKEMIVTKKADGIGGGAYSETDSLAMLTKEN